MIVLAFGDVCGPAGMRAVTTKLPGLKKFYGADLCIVNGENADILGIKPEQAHALFEAGADVITLGNHTWKRMQIVQELEGNPFLIRPLNFPPAAPGNGFARVPMGSGKFFGVVSLIGRLECCWNSACPFAAMDRLLEKQEADFYIVDFHAEATSEKQALARYLDGRVSAVYGTHTHVQTSDALVLPGGTGFITDLGMTGAEDSILGISTKDAIAHFTTGVPIRHKAPETKARLEGCLFEIDELTGKCTAVQSLRVEEEGSIGYN
ncbi:MAG: YmdB family metallophosphoesterase [Oscillospiraceae bacterium]|nr:YmdB family metallophosphoesterase [Oscillospiraceae bacterium]